MDAEPLDEAAPGEPAAWTSSTENLAAGETISSIDADEAIVGRAAHKRGA